MSKRKLRRVDLLCTLVDLHREDGRSARAIAARAGISPAYLSHLQSGRNDTVTAAVAVRLAGSLGVAPSVLFAPVSSIQTGRNEA